jgi:hypothetical protein
LHKSPGPGAYEIRSTIGSGKGAVLLGKNKQQRIDTHEVGFLNVDDRAVRKRSPVATLKGKTAHMLELTSNRFVPGPGHYNVNNPKTNINTISFGHPSEYRSRFSDTNSKNKENMRYQSPGPGAYKIRDDFGVDAKAVSILGKNRSSSYDKLKNSELPGPGSYNVNDRFSRSTAPSFSLKGAVSQDPIMREKQSVP